MRIQCFLLVHFLLFGQDPSSQSDGLCRKRAGPASDYLPQATHARPGPGRRPGASECCVMRAISGQRIPCQPQHAVEVLIGTGESAQIVRLHHRGHEPAGHLRQHVRGGQARGFLILDTLEQLAASGSEEWIRDEMVNERVGIEEDRLSGNKVGEDRAGSCGSNSTSSARCRRVAWSPVHLIIPAVSLTQLPGTCTVTLTRSCSFRGSG
jgi:hypothetical protein